jgi:hypothetical protein
LYWVVLLGNNERNFIDEGIPVSEKRKHAIITFKADPELAEALSFITNRSEFIRNAVFSALEGTCPLCQGKGTLTAAQRQHWDAFLENHHVHKCDECAATHLVCDENEQTPGRRKHH